MKIEKQKNFDKYIAIRVSVDDETALTTVARQLSLRPSEVSRRALRVGLKILQDSRLPGGVDAVADARS